MSASGMLVDATDEGVIAPSRAPNRHLLAPAWQPGQSGNPGGRSKRFFAVRAAAQDNSVEAIGLLAKMMRSDDERVAIIACNSILDRAFGKPKEQKDEDAQGLRPDLSSLSPPQLAALRDIAKTLSDQAAPHEGTAPIGGPPIAP